MGNRYHTIPVKATTWKRLKDYRMGDTTYDDILNALMDNVPLEVFTKKVLKEHQKRLKSLKGRNWRKVKEDLND